MRLDFIVLLRAEQLQVLAEHLGCEGLVPTLLSTIGAGARHSIAEEPVVM